MDFLLDLKAACKLGPLLTLIDRMGLDRATDMMLRTNGPSLGASEPGVEIAAIVIENMKCRWIIAINFNCLFYCQIEFKTFANRANILTGTFSIENSLNSLNDFGIILEQVGSFEPGTEKYPTFQDALNAAYDKNYGVATDHNILTDEVLNGYKKPVMTSTGTYCTVYDVSNYETSNKNRYMFTLSVNNTVANQKKFYNVYSYITITTPDGVTTTYISNVQTLNFYTIGTTDAIVNG